MRDTLRHVRWGAMYLCSCVLAASYLLYMQISVAAHDCEWRRIVQLRALPVLQEAGLMFVNSVRKSGPSGT